MAMVIAMLLGMLSNMQTKSHRSSSKHTRHGAHVRRAFVIVAATGLDKAAVGAEAQSLFVNMDVEEPSSEEGAGLSERHLGLGERCAKRWRRIIWRWWSTLARTQWEVLRLAAQNKFPQRSGPKREPISAVQAGCSHLQVKVGGNQHGHWKTCSLCRLRLEYRTKEEVRKREGQVRNLQQDAQQEELAPAPGRVDQQRPLAPDREQQPLAADASLRHDLAVADQLSQLKQDMESMKSIVQSMTSQQTQQWASLQQDISKLTEIEATPS